MTSSRRILHGFVLAAISWTVHRNVLAFSVSETFAAIVDEDARSNSIHRNITRYPQPSHIAIPDGCVEPKDEAAGWPIVQIATCRDTYLFKFEEQIVRPRGQMKTETSDAPSDEGGGRNGTSSCSTRVTVRCKVWDFKRPAHFIINFLPCWSAWYEYAQQNDANAELRLVPGDGRRLTEGDISVFVRDWIDIFDCSVEIDGEMYPPRELLLQNEIATCHTQQYIDVTFESVGVRGFPPANGFHFDLMKDWAKERGMFSYFLDADHAYALRSQAYSKLQSTEAQRRAIPKSNVASPSKVASPSFRVLFINRNNGKRVIGGDGIADIPNSISAKLSELGVPADGINVSYTEDFGAWDGYGQLQMMRDHDIIISPHGNQWSSIGFAPECAAVMEVYPRYFAAPGFFLPWAVNAGVQAFGLYDGAQIFLVEHYLKPRGRLGRAAVRDTPFINVSNEIVMALPALVEARTKCCQVLLDNGEWHRAGDSRCVG